VMFSKRTSFILFILFMLDVFMTFAFRLW
jgi:hypothetical protein